VARSTGEAAALQAQVERWHEDGIAVETPRSRHLGRVSPDVRLAYFLPAEAQIRPPRLLNALRTSCERSGVQFVHTTADPRIEHDEQRGYALHLDPGQVRFQQLCITTGAWTAKVAARLGIAIRIEPRRGQMVLFEPCPRALEWIICEGPRYLVPRRDGRILAGSTVEDVGFDSNTVERDIIRLADFARGLVPELRNVPVEAEWAGLRPYTGDGYPFLGGLPHLDHAFVAAGHFRSGIVTAPATARVMSQLILGERPDLDLHAFRLDRE
jgi:glycine oxidase